MKLSNSFAFKNAIFYFFIFLLGLGTVGYLMLNNSSNRIVETAKNQLVHNGDLIEIQLEDYIEGLIYQLNYLSTSPVLKKYLATKDSADYQLLASNYLSIILSNNDFSQVRYINASNGKEIVRVDRINGEARIVQVDQLQFKAGRPYYTETIKLDSGEVYFSDINLNREFGKISLPRTPTLRLACPFYQGKRLQGVIVINTDLTKLFSRLSKTVGSEFTLRMLNEKGYHIMHENEDSTFLFEMENTKKLNSISTTLMEKGIVSLPNELISVHRVRLKSMPYDFIYQVIAVKTSLMKPYFDWRRKSLWLIFLTGLVFTLIAFYILKKQSKTLRKLTNSMKEFSLKKKITDLPLHRDDEIGELAKSFHEMASIIKNQISSIEQEKDNAKEAEKEKSEFIENISHEVRNPLQSILGLSKMLEQNAPNPNQLDILNSIKLNTSNLVGLVNDILDYQSVIKGNYQSKYSWVNMTNLIQELLISNQYNASQKTILIESRLDDQLNKFDFKLDKLRVSQILNNLISNAVTHTAVNGKIIIESQLINNKDQKARVAFSVVDDGIGMSKDELLQIKERYFSNKAGRGQESNYGLGLTIVNELLNHLDSELKVSSQKNIGSTFYFELDLEVRDRVKEVKKTNNSIEVDGALKVLVIDDDEQILDLYRHFFKSMDVVYVSSFDQIKNHTKAFFDLIVTDFRLRNGDILNHLNYLKTLAIDEVGLVIASGLEPDMEVIRKTFPAAIAIKKPFDQEELNKQVNLALVLAKYGIPDINNIKSDYDFDHTKYSKALRLLIEEWKAYSIRIEESIEQKDSTELEEILHKLNTTLRRLSLPKLEARLIEIMHTVSSSANDFENERKEIKNMMSSYLTYLQQSI